MARIAVVIDEVLRNGLAQELRSAGFKKAARTWRKCVAELTQVTNVQASWTNHGDAGQFTINLGVYFPEAVRLFGLWAVKDKPGESDCIVHQRIGLLMPPLTDFWWTVNPGTNLESLGHEVGRAWRAHGLPWLDAHTDPVVARDWLKKKSLLWAAIFSVVTGDRATGRELFEQAVAESRGTAFEQHIDLWRANLRFASAG